MKFFFADRSRIFYIVSGLLQIFFIALIDYFLGKDIYFSYFYFIPISLVTWYVGEGAGLSMSILSGITWIVSEIFLTTESFSSGIFYINSALRLSFLIIIVLALYMLKSTLDSEKSYARADSLTGIANRRAFYERAELEIERLRRNKQPLSLAYIDLDDFKAVNDILGHETGDQVLFIVGSVIQQNIRKTDMVARLGGDEFAVLMPESSREQAELVVERIANDLLNAMKKNVWFVTFSIGVAVYNTAPNDVNEFLKSADRVMYSAKDDGKNAIKVEVIN